MCSLMTFEYLFLDFSTTKFDWGERNVFFNKCFGEEVPQEKEASPFLRIRGTSTIKQYGWTLLCDSQERYIFGTKNKLQGKRYCFQTFKTAVQMFFEDGLKTKTFYLSISFSASSWPQRAVALQCVFKIESLPSMKKTKIKLTKFLDCKLKFEITPTPWAQRHNAPLWRRS